MDSASTVVTRSPASAASVALSPRSRGSTRGDLIAVDLSPAHEDLTFMAPLSQARAGALVGFLAEGLAPIARPVVLDVGCGWAHLLLDVLAAVSGATGIGVDEDPAAIAHGRALAQERDLAGRVELRCADARTGSPSGVDAVVCIGASQIWGPPVEDARPLDYPAALGALRDLVVRGGRVVYGESIWSQSPTPAAIAPLAGRTDEHVSLPELLEIAAGHGFAPLIIHEASADEWDVFESGYAARYARWLAAHGSDHPDRGEVEARAARQRAAYFGGYRGVLGLAYLGLIAV